MSRPAPPSFWRQLAILWGLRVSLALNRGRRGGRAWAIAVFVVSCAPGVALGVGAYRVLTLPAVAGSEAWSDFALGLLGFVTACVLWSWPLLSAGVDDHSELSRYAAFPISGFRLMLASTLAALVEPRSLVLQAPLLGAALGYLHSHPSPAAAAFAPPLFLAFALFNAAWSRAGLHAALNLLRQRRSGELLGSGLVVLIGLASLIPPVDTRWLFSAGAGPALLPNRLVEDAARAFGRIPPGFLARGLKQAAAGDPVGALASLLWLVELTCIGLVVAYGLLLHFHRQGARAPAVGPGRANPFQRPKSRFATLVLREALDLWQNPRARLLAAVPFILAVLLKLLSARDLFVWWFGASADAWMMGGLCLYAAVLMGSTFAQNTFGYDGRGFFVFLASPIELDDVLRAKNLVHALAAAIAATAVGVFYRVYFGQGGLLEAALVAAGVGAVIPIVLTAGNGLSVLFPVKFHASLERRDRLPLAASAWMVAAVAAGCLPFPWLLDERGPRWTGAALLALWALAGWLLHAATFPRAAALLRERREVVLAAVTRE